VAFAIPVALFKVTACALDACVGIKNTKRKACILALILPKAASWYGPFNAIEQSIEQLRTPQKQ